VEGSPTLAVEVISPYTGRIDRSTKLNLYARFGVPFYWIVDPETRTIDVYRLVRTAYEGPQHFAGSLGGLPPFPGLTLDAASLWAPPTS
jgi:Uma2 family endonuclease